MQPTKACPTQNSYRYSLLVLLYSFHLAPITSSPSEKNNAQFFGCSDLMLSTVQLDVELETARRWWCEAPFCLRLHYPVALQQMLRDNLTELVTNFYDILSNLCIALWSWKDWSFSVYKRQWKGKCNKESFFFQFSSQQKNMYFSIS